MLNITKPKANRLDITFSGDLDSDQMQKGLDDFEEKAKEIENGVIYYEISDFHFPSLDAIAVKLGRLPSLFKLLGNFQRIAVITDTTWIQKVSEFEGFLIPKLEIKAFDLAQKDTTEAWLFM